MNPALLALTEGLVSVSDFSQGKTGKIFNDVAEKIHVKRPSFANGGKNELCCT